MSSGRTTTCGERPLNKGIAIMTRISRKIARIGSQMIASGPSTGARKGLSVR